MNLFLTENDACKHHVIRIQQKSLEQLRTYSIPQQQCTMQQVTYGMSCYGILQVLLQWLLQGGKHHILVSYPGHQKVKVKGHDS